MSITASVITLGDLLSEFPKLDIPDYQREFKWEPDKVKDLFGDVIEGLALKEGKPKSCFLGSLVVSINSKTGTVDLVDGQQRMTILTLMLRCLSDKCRPDSAERKRASKLLAGKDGRVLHHKKSPDSHCDDFTAYYECAIAQSPNLLKYGKNTNKATASMNVAWAKALRSSLIYKAQKALEQSIDRLLENRNEPEEALQQALGGIQLVVINADESKEAMRVFASINAGGTPLEAWELIKSSFYSHADNAKLKNDTYALFEGPENSFAKAYNSLKPEARDSNKNDVLRTHWVANFGLIAKDDLFDGYNDYISADASKARLVDLIKGISKTLSFHKSLESKVYRHRSIRVDTPFFHPLEVLKAKISLPILAAVIAKYEDEDELSEALQRCSFALEQMHVTWRVMGYAANTLDKHFADAAVSITKGRMGTTPLEVSRELAKHLASHRMMPTHGALVARFKTYLLIGEGKFSQLVAHRLNNALACPGDDARCNDYMDIPLFNKDGLSVEKGIKLDAENCSSDAMTRHGFKDESHLRDLIDSLGNLYAIKSGGSKISTSLPLNQGPAITDLDAGELEVRNRQLSDLSAKIWLPNSNL
jgi:hypothetical protein